MEGKLNPRSFSSIREAMISGKYTGRGQLLRDIYNAFRKKGKYAVGAGSNPTAKEPVGEVKQNVAIASPTKPISG